MVRFTNHVDYVPTLRQLIDPTTPLPVLALLLAQSVQGWLAQRPPQRGAVGFVRWLTAQPTIPA